MNLMKFHIWLSFENLSRKFKFNYNATKITYTLPEYVFTFIKISCWILFGKGNVSDESCRVNRNKHSLFTNISFFVVQTDRQTGSDDNTIRHMRFVCWITKATDTLRICNSYCWQQYEIFCDSTCVQWESIVASPWQYWTVLYCWQLLVHQWQ